MRDEVFEVTSWQLTVERINKILIDMDINKYKAWTTFDINDVKRYFASVMTFLDEVYVTMTEEELKEIQKNIKTYWDNFTKILTDGQPITLNKIITMLTACDKIQQLARFFLQKKEYFFKMSEKEIKRIEDTLKVMKEGGSIFG